MSGIQHKLRILSIGAGRLFYDKVCVVDEKAAIGARRRIQFIYSEESNIGDNLVLEWKRVVDDTARPL